MSYLKSHFRSICLIQFFCITALCGVVLGIVLVGVPSLFSVGMIVSPLFVFCLFVFVTIWLELGWKNCELAEFV